MPDNLTFYEYERLAAQTMSEETRADSDSLILTAALGFAGEGGEFCDIIKKVMFHGHLLDDAAKMRLRKEIGDILWYCAAGAAGLDTTLDWIARDNIEKLRARYPNGFSHEASRARYADADIPESRR